MTLLALMYHRARAGRHGNAPAMLDAHFAYIAERFRCVLPGEELVAGSLNVCLTFDDAYYDFYAMVFPLLRRHGLRAVLAVPVGAIHESASGSRAERLAAEPNLDGGCSNCGGFCTWGELQEMAASDQVMLASHGFTHRALLDENETSLHTEIVVSQALLSSRIGREVRSFVFPYGRFSPAALTCAQRNYRHIFRIGGADNAGWDSDLLYRVDADEMETPQALFHSRRLCAARVRRYWNRVRGR